MIILYNPQSSANRKPILPMSLLAVGAVLEGQYDYRILDGNLEDDPLAALDAAVRAAGPRPVLGLTVMPGPQLQQAVSLCQQLRQRHPHLTIVWGGYFPTQHWDVCLRSDFIDYVVRGHSEIVFLHLLAELDQNPKSKIENLKSIPGLAYRDETGQPASNPLAPIPHPSKLPMWNFDRLPVARYVRPTFLGSRTLGYHSSYGCPFFCNFCAVVNMVNGRWFPQTAESVAGVVRMYHERWGVNAVEFYDNNFFTHQARVAEFSERIMDLGVAWWGEGRIDTMQMYSDKTWRLMSQAGLKMVFMGAESGSDETLKRMDKGGQMSTARTLEMARLMKSYGVVPEFSFVMGNPPDPEADLRLTMEFIRKVKRINPASEIIMYLYTPVPLAGDLYDEARAEGFAFPETLEEWISPEWLNFSQRRSTTMPWIKRTLQEQIHDFERVINAYYPTSTDARLTAFWRTILRSASAWRYHLRFYHFPVELRALHKLVAYQRPETSGF
ncbi:MAG: cobalamin-dependent protein [Chloroflexi bacterium]|nr:cobalamin-dependent protein [Chloroflexota bacterium]MCI0576666.1 cobalamin-dependent protein [Chloroflexota bacterium]MCI0647979.1 cobalamin-dependent protein [Chloroflexota bacterium]MCI0726811.1 cobalamin-dependent protein [Chloroflexota bacterium]